MKVGDLVRLTYPGAENTGLVVEMWTPHEQTDEHPIIMWAAGGVKVDGVERLFPPDHEFLELVAES